jgi:hypothetical protein
MIRQPSKKTKTKKQKKQGWIEMKKMRRNLVDNSFSIGQLETEIQIVVFENNVRFMPSAVSTVQCVLQINLDRLASVRNETKF